MAQTKLILRKLSSPYTGIHTDITKNSVLSHQELDGNQIYLKGEIVYTGQTSGNDLILNKINGNTISIDLSSIAGGGPSSGNTFVTGMTNTGPTLELTRNDAVVISLDLTSLIDFPKTIVQFSASTSGQTLFSSVLPSSPTSPEKSDLYVNGVRQVYGLAEDYVITGGTSISWVSIKHSIEVDDDLLISYL